MPALVVFAALAIALARVNKALAAVGSLFGIVSETIALTLGSSPQSLHGGLVVLADSYAVAGTDAGRASLASAAEALIAATNAVSWAGILTAAAILLLSLVIWQAGWGRGLAIVGIVAGTIGVASEALRPLIGPAYLAYGLLLPVWFAWVGWKLLHVPASGRAPAR